MRVLLVCVDFPPNVGGVAAHVYELGRELVRQGSAVRVLTYALSKDAPPVAEEAGMDVRRHRPAPRLISRFQLGGLVRRAVAEFRPDVVHVHGIRPLTATRGIGVPVVFTNHTSGFLRRIERGGAATRRVGAMMRHVARVIAPSRELVEAGVAAGYPEDRSRYIPNGVDTERFHPGVDGAPLRAAWGVPPDGVVVLAARRMVPKNGMTYLARAARGFLADGVDDGVTLVMVGDGEEFGRVKGILDEDGVLKRCVLTGSIDNREMPAYYGASSIVVLPSLKEATSVAGLEAMATGRPLVGTRVGGIPDLIVDGETGVLVPPADPHALAEGIDKLVRDPAFRERAGALGRKRAEEHFSWPVIVRRTVDVYREVA